jgi:hypothetical protein
MNNATRTLFYNTANHFIPKCKDCIFFIQRSPKFTNNLANVDKCKLFAEPTSVARNDQNKCGKYGTCFEDRGYLWKSNCDYYRETD